MTRGFKMTRQLFAHGILVTLALPTALGPSPARADRCDDLASPAQEPDRRARRRQDRGQPDLSVASARPSKSRSAAPAATSANQLFAKADSRKPQPAFLDLVASAAAIIFTLPKDDMLKGATRCIKRMGLFHGDDVATRYRRLDMRCSRTRTEASIAISRSTDQ